MAYLIGNSVYDTYEHHESFAKLWELKWKRSCSMGIYPFMFGCVSDFEPVVRKLTADGAKKPYDWNSYAEAFFPNAERLVKAAEQAENLEQNEKASEFYLRASALYRIARYPIPRSEKQIEAWELNKDVFMRGQALLPNPVQEVMIPHTHGLPDEGKYVKAYAKFPQQSHRPAPVVIHYCGLNGFRTESATYCEPFRQAGIALIVVEIPGTGDSPVNLSDPNNGDRQTNSILDWIQQQPHLDEKQCCLWGASTGGYYAVRAAHNQASRLKGAICQGGGVHHMFDKEWLDEVNHLEYSFDLADDLAFKWGYGTDVEKFKAEAKEKYSLLLDGTLNKPSTRLLLVNGYRESTFPIDDMYLLIETGPSPTEARILKERTHMGNPEAEGLIFRWIFDLFDMPEKKQDLEKYLKLATMEFKYEVDE